MNGFGELGGSFGFLGDDEPLGSRGGMLDICLR